MYSVHFHQKLFSPNCVGLKHAYNKLLGVRRLKFEPTLTTESYLMGLPSYHMWIITLSALVVAEILTGGPQRDTSFIALPTNLMFNKLLNFSIDKYLFWTPISISGKDWSSRDRCEPWHSYSMEYGIFLPPATDLLIQTSDLTSNVISFTGSVQCIYFFVSFTVVSCSPLGKKGIGGWQMNSPSDQVSKENRLI